MRYIKDYSYYRTELQSLFWSNNRSVCLKPGRFRVKRASSNCKSYIVPLWLHYNIRHEYTRAIAQESHQHILTLQWRHNESDGISKHPPHDCLLRRFFRCRSKITSKFRVTGLCEGNSPMTGEFPAQMASNAENVSIWWCHHDICVLWLWFIVLPVMYNPKISQTMNKLRRGVIVVIHYKKKSQLVDNSRHKWCTGPSTYPFCWFTHDGRRKQIQYHFTGFDYTMVN